MSDMPPSSGQALVRAERGGLPEPVEQNEDELEYKQFLSQYQPDQDASKKPDLLEERFRIVTASPLTEYNSSLGRAYEVVDERNELQNLYAVLSPAYLGIRSRTAEAIRTLSHPNLVTLHAAGNVYFSASRDTKFAAVFARPKGTKLSNIIAKQGALAERFVTDHIIAPIAEIVSALQERGINHGRLNLDTLYYSDRLTVGECVSEPSGVSQPMHFEPVERLLTQTLGKGSGETGADCFALGVIVFCLLTGRLPTQLPSDRSTYLRQIMQNGTYATLTQFQNFSPAITDFFRGVLNDNRMERWGTPQIREWLTGKRYNLIAPAPPRESTRSFSFKGQDFMNCRALALAFHESWDDAIEEMKNGKFNRWAQLSLNKQDMKEMIDKIISRGTTSRGSNPKSDNEMVARTIITLDPTGPIRMRSLAANIDGLGAVLADAFHSGNHEQMAYLADIIDNDLPNFWSDQHKALDNQEITSMLWRLQKVRLLMRNRHLGFGMERVLYELNPTMACQSPMIQKYNVTSAEELLRTLDRLARDMAVTHLPLDRHSAAFLATKLSLNKEITFPDLSAYPTLANDSKLVMLKMLAIAQEKQDFPGLRGLANWIAIAVQPLVQSFHHRKIRQSIIQEINANARQGQLAGILRALINTNNLHANKHDFERAQFLWRRNERAISSMSNPEMLAEHSRRLGHQLSAWIGYALVLVMTYVTCSMYMGI